MEYKNFQDEEKANEINTFFDALEKNVCSDNDNFDDDEKTFLDCLYFLIRENIILSSCSDLVMNYRAERKLSILVGICEETINLSWDGNKNDYILTVDLKNTDIYNKIVKAGCRAEKEYFDYNYFKNTQEDEDNEDKMDELRFECERYMDEL